ncbi:MAG: tail fiber domain-containing protein, partial [Flavobacteriales bacterium]|nr:tail fiber domain-containing protein [Flavobacteriales bacterium]
TSGARNTAVGFNAGFGNLTGSGNVLLGASAGRNETGSDKLYIDNNNTTSPLVYGDFSANKFVINGDMGIGINPTAYDLDIYKAETSVNQRVYANDALGIGHLLVGANGGGHVNLIANSSAATYLGIPVGVSGLVTEFTDMVFATGTGGAGSERMRITTGGSVGIGTTPNVAFHVVAPGASDQVVARFTQSNTTNGNSTLVGLSTEGSTWSKGAIGFQRTGSYDVGDITFNLNTNNASGTDVSESDERMRITSDGRVGIGTNNPTQAKLVVSGSVTYSNLNARYYNSGGANGSTTSNRNLSAYFSDHIACGELQVFSDQRIKNVVGVSDSKADMNTLMNIRVTDYTFKDTVGKGNNVIKKVIAQQVEQVYPQAVGTITDVVPDIYKLAEITDGRIAIANTLKAGEKVRLVLADRTELVEVVAANADGFSVALKDNGQVFVFGREVSDFRTVDYEALSMLNLSATQELVRMINGLKSENEAMKANFSSLSSDVEMLKAMLNAGSTAGKE